MIFISYWYWMKHVISHIHSVFVYWMKHVTFQLSEHSCAVWYHSQSDIICDLILSADLISSAVWYCWQIWYDLQFDIIHSLILCAVWYYLHSFILFFLFNLNCTFTSLYILRLEHALLILYFLHYIITESDDIFQKEAFVMNMMLSWHLISLNYSLCADQKYISIHSFIALRKSFILLLLYCVYSFLQSFIVFLHLSIYWKTNRSFSSLDF